MNHQIRKSSCWLFSIVLAASTSACGSDKDEDTALDTSTDDADTQSDAETTEDTADTSGEDSTEDTSDVDPGLLGGAYGTARQTAVDEIVIETETDYPVHITFDTFGVPHILAESWEDAMFAQGWVQALQRFPQMEFFKRATNGTTSYLGGKLSSDVVADDLFIRVLGFRRLAREIYDSLPADSIERRTLNAHAAGVNAYIRELQAKRRKIPAPLAFLINPDTLQLWEPWECLAIVRYQQKDLSFFAQDEIDFSEDRVEVAAKYPADSEDPATALRSKILSDLYRFQPADRTYQIPGFSPDNKDAGTRPRSEIPWQAPSLENLRLAQEFGDFPRSKFFPRIAEMGRGASNSWAVSPSKSASGHALLANDPHLGLDSPTIFHMAHVSVEPRTEADGPALNVSGVQFPGLPGIIIGHNERVAWGVTTSSIDIVDVYRETLIWREGETTPRVLRNGEEVPVEVHTEVLDIGARGNQVETKSYEIWWVPGRGPIIPEISGDTLTYPTGNEALSYAWPGFRVTNELRAILGWMTSENLDDVKATLPDWEVGTQNLLFADVDGNIWSSPATYLPGRPAAAMDWDPNTNPNGWAPWWILDGTGQHDWTAEPIALDRIPNRTNPDRGFLATANNDQGGVTDTNNPLQVPDYMGWSFDIGFRGGRIDRLLNGDTLVFPPEHKFTPEDMGRVQADNYSDYVGRLRPFLLQSLDGILAEYETPGATPEITELVEAHPDDREKIQTMRDWISNWSLYAESGVWGTPSEAQVQDARAASVANFYATALIQSALYDEIRDASISAYYEFYAKALLLMLESPSECATYDDTTAESVLWDVVTTEEKESREWILANAAYTALTEASTAFGGSPMSDWLWGKLHTRSFYHLIPDVDGDALGGTSKFDFPQPEEPWFETGYPRNGDNFNVDACNGGVSDFNFECGGGATLRYVVELDPAGIKTWNVTPGGQVMDPESPHLRDQLDNWLDYERFETRYSPDAVGGDVVKHVLISR